MSSNSDTVEISLESLLSCINAISLQIHSSANLTDMLNVTVQQARETLDCDRVMIYQFLPEGDGAVTAESVGAGWIAILGGLINGSCFSQDLAYLYEAGKFSVIEDTQTKPMQSSYADLLAKMQVKANIVMPILIGAQAPLFGLIIAHQCDRPRQWQSQEISLLQNISTQLAIALRYTSQEQLHKSAQKNDILRQYALKITGDGVWDWDILSSQVFFCPQWNAMLGFKDSEIRNDLSEWDSRVHPDDRDRAYIGISKHFRGETEQYTDEYRLRCKDGSYKWILARGQVISRAADGSPLRFICTNVDISDRKKIELALHKSEENQRAILASLPDLLLRVSRDGSCLDCIMPSNAQANQFVPISEHISEVLSPDILSEQLQSIERAINTKELQIFDQQLLKFGKIAYEEIRIAAINDNEALVIIRDITSQVESERRLEQISHNVPGTIYQFRLRPDGSSHFPYASQGLYDIYGISPEEVIEDARLAFACIHPEDLEPLKQAIAESAQNLTAWDCEYRVRHPDGRIIWVTGHSTPQREADGNILWNGYFKEITERKQSEIALIESETKLREANAELNALFAAQTDVVLIRNAEGKCIKVVPTNIHNLIGKIEEMLSETIYEELPQPAASIITTAIKKALATKKVVSCDYILPIHGTENWFAANVSPIAEDRVMQVTRDITDRKQVEIALAKAKESAEASARAKSEFLANMSHEIRTPMSGVLGMAKLLSFTSLTEEQSDYVQAIRDSGNILLSVINDILDFSKIEAGKLELEKSPFVLEDAVKSVFNLIRNQSTNQETIIKYAIAADVPTTIVGDRGRFSQILINLIGNAVKFSKQGQVLLSISYLNSSSAQLLFSIKDTGIGISRDRITTLFQPFAQADASISRQYGGTGLGLVICKHLVKLMDGSIWVESKGAIAGEPPLDWQISTNLETEGSIFGFAIALPNIKPMVIAPKLSVSGASSNLMAEQTPLKILIVEDNLFNQKIALGYLKKFGYLADIANNGAEALNMVSSQTYDLLFMDMQMPVMDGITATKAIRQNSLLQPQPKIVAMTANVMSEDVQSCLEAGMNDHISKPVQIDELVRILTQFQNKH